MKLLRDVWAEINLDNLAHNIKEVRRVTKINAKIMAVIKADGYGHGAIQIAKTLLENGADRFAVATLCEALLLRESFPTTEIMILGFTPNRLAQEVIQHNIIQTVCSFQQAELLSNMAKKSHKTITIHIKIDTGMSRFGMPINNDTIAEILRINSLDCLFIEGIYTHFALADIKDKTFTLSQVEKFNNVVHSLEEKGLNISIKHVSNSAAIIDLPELSFDMVRAGIMLYGLYPSPNVLHDVVNLKEVMCLKARISQIKTIKKGCGISYGLNFKATKQTTIAVLSIGYADGYTRMLSGKATVLINKVKVPILGSICMDQCVADITNIDVSVGDEVVIFGGDNDDGISIDSVANLLNTINYEIVCMVNKRVPRVYSAPA